MSAMNPPGRIVQLSTSPGGIPKRPLPSAVLTPRGLEGDDWAHPKYHGGPEQALLLIGMEIIEELRGLGYPVFPGALGENLTTEGLDYRTLAAGQRYRAGQHGEIELTKLREPCRTLDVYNGAGRERLQKLLKVDARGGWYARVLRGGTLFPGDPILFESQLV
jgi:MOSC domain-containing protein YiiM